MVSGAGHGPGVRGRHFSLIKLNLDRMSRPWRIETVLSGRFT
jgi:hypothetical protein